MAINDETLRLAKALRITIGEEVDAAVRDIVRAWARAWDEIHDAWADAMMDLAAAAQDGAWPSPVLIARSERAQAALLAATDQIVQLTEFADVTVIDGVGRIVSTTADAQLDLIASQAPARNAAEIAARFNRLDELALSRMVDRTRQQITARSYPLAQQGREAMYRALIRGVALGSNPKVAAAEMVRRAENAFNGGLTRALVIARTEMLDAHREAARGTRVANAGVTRGWVWMSALDARTCPSCWSKHGSEHDVAEGGPDDHQQGRCTAVPLLKTWRDLGFDVDEPASVMPDAQAAFGDLSAADQLAVMGKGRLAALDAGVPWGDLATQRSTPGWRDSWAPTPVRDLLALIR